MMSLICGIVVEPAESAEKIEFHRDVAGIIWNNCTNCHRPGQAGPFSLISYNDVKKRSRQIKEVVEDGYMPPWHAESAHIQYKDDRRLSASEKKTLLSWIDNGLEEGDAGKAPAMPEFNDDWMAGTPDMVVTMPEPYEVYAEGRDIYRNFVFPLNNKETLWVKAIEIRPSARSVVHHALYFADTTGSGRERDARDPEPGFRGMGFTNRLQPLGGWAVGGSAKPLPEGMAFKIPPNSDIVIQTHFHPSGKVEKEATSLGLYLTDEPAKRRFTGIQLPPRFGILAGIDIAPGNPNYVVKDSFVIPAEVEAFGIGAHAHYIGKKMMMTATRPDGEVIELMRIDDWDFNWQESYLFEKPIILPAGTRVDSLVSWDNSAENPSNPSNPPKRVRWGPYSYDEMGSVTLRVSPVKEEDFSKIKKELSVHQTFAIAESILARSAGSDSKRKKSFFELQVVRFDRNKNGKFDKDEIPDVKETIRKYDLNFGERINDSL